MAVTIDDVTIKMRRGTAARWTAANPILAGGEQGLETDTRKEKIGDGVTAWNDLAYKNTGTGADGADGASAYEIWIAAGNSGTEADFLASLRGVDGVDGANGVDGADGASAYEIWIAAGNTGTEADFLASLQGTPGGSLPTTVPYSNAIPLDGKKCSPRTRLTGDVVATAAPGATRGSSWFGEIESDGASTFTLPSGWVNTDGSTFVGTVDNVSLLSVAYTGETYLYSWTNLGGGVTAPSVTLNALTLSANSFTEGDTAGTVIGAIQGRTTGSALSVTPSDTLAIASGNLVVGLTPASAGTINATITEIFEGATNTPRDTDFTINVNAAASFGPDDYVITIDTRNTSTGSTASDQFQIPSAGDYTVDWGDGSAVETVTGSQPTHTYATAGIYQVVISNTSTLNSIIFANTNDKLKLLSIDQWGTAQWSSMGAAYYGCTNLTIPATDAPDLSLNPSMFRAFRGTTFTNSINHWDTSAVTNMSSLLEGTTGNPDVSGWDVSSVTNLTAFAFGSNFNQDLSAWTPTSCTTANSFLSSNTAFSTANYDALLTAWSALTLQPNVSISFGSTQYSASVAAARQVLVDAPNSWTIVDGGQV